VMLGIGAVLATAAIVLLNRGVGLRS
jgi:hypothetical protein